MTENNLTNEEEKIEENENEISELGETESEIAEEVLEEKTLETPESVVEVEVITITEEQKDADSTIDMVIEEEAERNIWEKVAAKLTTATGKMVLTGIVFLCVGLAGGYYWGSQQQKPEEPETFMGMDLDQIDPSWSERDVIEEMPEDGDSFFY